jgi:uncharacterized protein (TIGR03067 family)
MNRYALTVLVTLALCAAVLSAAGDAKQDAAQKELKRLEGTWEAVAAVVDGVKQEPKKGMGHHLVIRGDKYTLEHTDGKSFGKGTLKVDPSKKPKAIDLLPAEGKEEGKAIPCIYDLNGDELRLCVGRIGRPRPTNFAAADGSKHILTTYRRLGPK